MRITNNAVKAFIHAVTHQSHDSVSAAPHHIQGNAIRFYADRTKVFHQIAAGVGVISCPDLSGFKWLAVDQNAAIDRGSARGRKSGSHNQKCGAAEPAQHFNGGCGFRHGLPAHEGIELFVKPHGPDKPLFQQANMRLCRLRGRKGPACHIHGHDSAGHVRSLAALKKHR